MNKTVLNGHGGKVSSVSICRESQIVAGACENHTIQLWDSTTKQVMDPLEGHAEAVKAVAFSPRGRFLASAAKDRLVKMWNPSWRVEYVLQGHRGPVNALAFTSDCRWLASGGGEAGKPGEVILWDLAKASSLAHLQGHAAEVMALAVSPDRQTLVSSDAAGVVILWDLNHLQAQLTWTAHDGAAAALAMHPEGKALVTGGQDGRVKWWSLPNGKELGNRRGDSSPVLAAAFSAHGRQLAIGCLDGHVKIWKVACAGPWFKLCRLKKPVYSLAYSPERMLLAAGPDENVTLWQTRREIRSPMTQNNSKDATRINSGRDGAPQQRKAPAPLELQEFMSTMASKFSEFEEKCYRDLESADVA